MYQHFAHVWHPCLYPFQNFGKSHIQSFIRNVIFRSCINSAILNIPELLKLKYFSSLKNISLIFSWGRYLSIHFPVTTCFLTSESDKFWPLSFLYEWNWLSWTILLKKTRDAAIFCFAKCSPGASSWLISPSTDSTFLLVLAVCSLQLLAINIACFVNLLQQLLSLPSDHFFLGNSFKIFMYLYITFMYLVISDQYFICCFEGHYYSLVFYPNKNLKD